jgi:hypothetical protein
MEIFWSVVSWTVVISVGTLMFWAFVVAPFQRH